MLRAIRVSIRDDEDLVPELWVFNILIESQLPTVALFVLLLNGWMTPYQVLVAPAIVIYFLFITLSTLRLRPSLTFITGLLSAAGYLLVTFYVELNFSDSTAASGEISLPRLYRIRGIDIFRRCHRGCSRRADSRLRARRTARSETPKRARTDQSRSRSRTLDPAGPYACASTPTRRLRDRRLEPTCKSNRWRLF